MSDYEMIRLRGRIERLEKGLLEEIARTNKIIAALDEDSVCAGLGHSYVPPSLQIRMRIESASDGWEVARCCVRCGDQDGIWKTEHWAIPAGTIG